MNTNFEDAAEQVTLSSITQEALDKFGDTELTIKEVVRRIPLEPEILRSLAAEAVGDVIFSAAGHPPQKPTRSPRKPTAALAKGAPSLLDFTLAGGLKLGDATRAEVLAHAVRYRKQGEDMSHKGRFLHAVAENLPAPRQTTTPTPSE